MADLKIKDAPQAATANATDRLPVSQGTGDAVTVTVAQINTVHEAKLDPHTQYLLESDAAAAYEPKNVNIQQHIASTSDPHNTQWDQLGGTLTKLPFNTDLAAQTLSAGEIAWNPDERTFDMGINGVTLQAGQEMVAHVRNSTASTISNGTVCMAVGTIGASGRITVAPMDGTNSANAMKLLGIATEDIPAGQDGFVTAFGKVRGVDTSAFSEGEVLYTSTTVIGGLTNVAPTTGLKQPIAYVITDHASVGTLFVRIETLNALAFEPANSNIQAHIGSTANPHSVTYSQVGAEPANANIQQHISSTSNPHSVTATQVGLGNVLNATQEVISAKGQALGYCPLDGGAKVSETYLPDSVLGQVDYQGTWNATTNTPTMPAADSTNKGHYYIVAVSGTTNVDGITDWTIGDWIISNGVAWNKVDNTDSVSSVFGRGGAIVANAGDYNASQITNTPAGNIAAVTVQAAINELDTEKADATATTAALAGKENFHGIESYGTIAFNNGTQTLSVASITYWYKGSKFTSAIPITAQITSPVADNLYFFYFTNLTGVLTVSTTPWTLKEHVLLATVNWNGSVGAVVRETHNHTRDIDWHYNAHNTIGARYQSGLALVYPSTVVDNQINISSGTIWDEDIRTDIGNETEARLWYKTATSYTFDSTPTALPYKWNSGTSRVQYLDTDTNTLTDLATNQYTVVWVYATPDIDVPIWILVGEHATPYGTAAAARAATPPSLSTSPVTPESKLIYRWIFQGNGEFIESSDYRQASSLPAGGTASTSAASVTFTPSGNISSSNVQGAVEELDTEKADKSGKLSQFAATTSAELAGVISDETGSGSLVFAASPTLITPNIGVATGTSFNTITGLATASPLVDGTAAVGVSTKAAKEDHVHPTDTSRAADNAVVKLTGDQTVAGAKTFASVVATTADINGGTIDGTAIGGTTPAAGAFTTARVIGNNTNSVGQYILNNESTTYGTFSAYGSNGDGLAPWVKSFLIEAIPASGGNFVLSAYGCDLIIENGNRSETARFSSTGNLLVGTTTDDGMNKLQVNGGISARGVSSVIGNSSNAYTPQFLVGDSISPTTGKQLWLGYNTTADYGYIQAAHNGTAYTALAVNSLGGSLLIGTTTDDGVNKLQVNGGGYFSGGISVGSPSKFQTGGTPQNLTNNYEMRFQAINNTTVQLTYRGGDGVNRSINFTVS